MRVPLADDPHVRARRDPAALADRPRWEKRDHEPPNLALNNGVQMPALGLGVFQTPPDETRDAVPRPLDSDYRLIDTAASYGNEHEVGEAVQGSSRDRSEVFLQTKIWISDDGYDETLHGFDKSARELGVDQIDLLLLHQALPSAFDRTLAAYRARSSRNPPSHRPPRCARARGHPRSVRSRSPKPDASPVPVDPIARPSQTPSSA